MGSLSEFFDYINNDNEISDREALYAYSYITITSELKKIRNEYQKWIRKQKKLRSGDQEKLF